MRVWKVGVIMGCSMIASAARADFKVEAGLLPQPVPKVAPAVVPPPVLPQPAAVAPVADTVKPAEPEAAAPKRAPLVERKEPVWIVKPGSSLRAVVDEFTRRAGWVVEFEFKDELTLQDKDLTLGGGLRVEGDFKKAIRAVFDSLDPLARIDAELWPENDPPTIYIFRKGKRK